MMPKHHMVSASNMLYTKIQLHAPNATYATATKE